MRSGAKQRFCNIHLAYNINIEIKNNQLPLDSIKKLQENDNEFIKTRIGNTRELNNISLSKLMTFTTV